MAIYLLINYPDNSYDRIKKAVDLKYIKSNKNQNILEKLYLEENRDIDSDVVIGLFEDQETVNYISGILASDFEIEDVEKAIEDIEKYYLKESKLIRRNEILSKLSNKESMSKEEVTNLEKELNNIILELAKIK